MIGVLAVLERAASGFRDGGFSLGAIFGELAG
jgi:hypothetical protein